jgi:pimeloyl-ACP methyl ester carboxylesterase
MRRSARLLLPALLALSATACVGADWGARALLYPYRRPITRTPDPPPETLTLPGAGITLRGWRLRTTAPRRGTVIWLHGIGDNRQGALGPARRLGPRGWDVVTYDARAHGESGGEHCTYGVKERQDLAAVITALGGGPVVVMGHSLGGAVALQAAAHDPRIVAVVAVAPFSDLRTAARERAPWFASGLTVRAALRRAGQRGGFVVDEASPVAAARRIRVPVLLVHGAADRATPVAHSRRILAALAGSRALVIVPGAGHGRVLRTAETWVAVHRFLDTHQPATVEPPPRRAPACDRCPRLAAAVPRARGAGSASVVSHQRVSRDAGSSGLETGDRQPATGNRKWRISCDAWVLIMKTGPGRVDSWEFPIGCGRPAADETGVPSAPALAPASARSSSDRDARKGWRNGQGRGRGRESRMIRSGRVS